MPDFKLMDVTLRDGGNRNHFAFTQSNLLSLLPALDEAGIEYIEVGYRNGAIHPADDLGPAGLCAWDYLTTCRALIKRAKLAVMFHARNVTRKDLQELKKSGVDLLRICIQRHQFNQVLAIVEDIKQLALPFSLNFIHISQYNETELDEVVDAASLLEPTMIYFADSNGSALPDKIERIFAKYTQQYSQRFGFHAHDNLGLAQMNTLAALKGGASYIDAALAGMGKGIGNLKTEFFVAYLKAIQQPRYQLSPLVNAANYVRTELFSQQTVVEMDEFIRGICDLSTAQVKALVHETPDIDYITHIG